MVEVSHRLEYHWISLGAWRRRHTCHPAKEALNDWSHDHTLTLQVTVLSRMNLPSTQCTAHAFSKFTTWLRAIWKVSRRWLDLDTHKMMGSKSDPAASLQGNRHPQKKPSLSREKTACLTGFSKTTGGQGWSIVEAAHDGRKSSKINISWIASALFFLKSMRRKLKRGRHEGIQMDIVSGLRSSGEILSPRP